MIYHALKNRDARPTATSRFYSFFIFVFSFAVLGTNYYFQFPPLGWEAHANGYELGFIAKNIVDGRGFSNPFAAGTQPTAFLPPFAPFLVASLFYFFGCFSAASLSALYAAQAFGGAIASVAYFHLCKSILGETIEDCRTGALLVTVIATIWPSNLWVPVPPWYLLWQDVGTAVAILAYLHWDRTPRPLASVTYGISIGVLGLISPAPLVALAVASFIRCARLDKNSTNKLLDTVKFKSLLLSGVVALAIISPWIWRTYSALGGLYPIRSNYNLEFFIGNSVASSPVVNNRVKHPVSDREEYVAYTELGERAYMQKKGLEALTYVKQNPQSFIVATVQRFYLFWFTDLLDTWSNPESARWMEQGVGRILRKLINIGQYLFVSLGLFALIVFKKFKPLRHQSLLYSFAILYPVPYYFSHVINHYAFPLQRVILIYVLCAIFICLQSTRKTIEIGRRG